LQPITTLLIVYIYISHLDQDKRQKCSRHVLKYYSCKFGRGSAWSFGCVNTNSGHLYGMQYLQILWFGTSARWLDFDRQFKTIQTSDTRDENQPSECTGCTSLSLGYRQRFFSYVVCIHLVPLVSKCRTQYTIILISMSCSLLNHIYRPTLYTLYYRAQLY